MTLARRAAAPAVSGNLLFINGFTGEPLVLCSVARWSIEERAYGAMAHGGG